MVSNAVNVNPSIFHQCPLNASWGELISQTISSPRLVKAVPARYQYIEISLFDQSLAPLIPLDPELVLSLLVEVDEED
jgi:hypothetical protein